MRFMVLVPGNPESEAGEMPRTEDLEAMTKYNEELVKAGVMLAGDGLHPTSKGARVRFAGSERTVIDGPFTEAKEIVAGYWIWECASSEEAIEWLKRAPFDGGSEIELRPIFEAEDFGEELTPELRERTSGCASRPLRRARAVPQRRATDRAIEAVWRIESARLIAGLARIVRRRAAGRGPRPGRPRRRAGAVAAVGHPGQPGRLAHGHRQAPGASTPLRRRSTLERKQDAIAHELRVLQQLEQPDLARAGRRDVGDDLLRLMFIACHPVLVRARRASRSRCACSAASDDRRDRPGVPRRPRRPSRSGSSGPSARSPRRTFRSRCPRRDELRRRLSSVLEVDLPHLQRGLRRDRGRRLDAAGAVRGGAAAGAHPRRAHARASPRSTGWSR